MTADKILALLAGHDSKKPMSFDDLAEKSGLLYATLEMVLEQMHHQVPAPINCAQITRGGKTQWVYWPTGVVEKAERQPIIIGSGKPPPIRQAHPASIVTAPPRIHCPDTSKAINRMSQKAINHMEQNDMEQQPLKSRGAAMLELLAEKREATYQQLLDISGAKVVDPFIKGNLKRGLVIRDGRNYRVAEGVTAEMLLADTRKQNLPPTRKQPEAEPAKAPPIVFNEPKVQFVSDAEFIPTKLPEFIPMNFPEYLRMDDPEAPSQCAVSQIFIDDSGQIILNIFGQTSITLAAADVLRIKRLLAAVDLESLAA